MAHSDLREDPEEVHHDMVTIQSLPVSGKQTISDSQIEDAGTKEPENLVYLAEEEPELHLRTYIAWGAMILVNFVQVLSLQSPPSVLSYIGKDLNNTAAQTWVPNALSLVQAVLTPILSSASDIFQARKGIMVTCYIISFIGSSIAPGAQNIYRVIGAQIMIGAGFSCVALVYTVPSEILPRKWRPVAQASINVAASLGACIGPLIIGALTRNSAHNGWRNFYWVQMALWGMVAIGVSIGYRPPKRHTALDHLSFWQKLGQLDLLGCALLSFGLTLFLIALNLGGGLYTWKNARVLTSLLVGIAGLAAFCLYEWKGTKTGIVHHELLGGGKNMGRTFAICMGLMALENILAFSYIIFYPTLTSLLFEHDPFLLTARLQPFWIGSGLSTLIWGYSSTRFRTIKEPLFAGFLVFTAGIVGLCTVQPDDSLNSLVFACLAGIGFGCPLVLVVAGVHLSTPHGLIATATGLVCAVRATAATIGTAIFAAALTTRLATNVPSYTIKAAVGAGLPSSSIDGFLQDFLKGNTTGLSSVAGATPKVIAAASTALAQAYADSIRVVYIIAAPFGVVACVARLFLGDVRKVMTFRVDAPVEELHAKGQKSET